MHGLFLYNDVCRHRWKNRLLLLTYVVSGKLSLVGAPIYDTSLPSSLPAKSGLTGLVQINENRIHGVEQAESYQLYYIQNYSIGMDMDILVKSIYHGPPLLKRLESS